MSVLQGGNGFPFLADPVYDFLATGKTTNIVVRQDQLPDPSLQVVVGKVSEPYMTISVCVLKCSSYDMQIEEAKCDADIKGVFEDLECYSMLEAAGYT